MFKLVADSSEVREGSKLEANTMHEHIEVVPNLEALTGADFMLTPSDLPANSLGLIELHIQAGARLIQRKTGMDFIQSLGTRMNESLARMVGAGAQPWQSVLLIIGEFTHGSNGNAHWRHAEGITDTAKPYWQVYGAIMKWKERGGIVDMIPDTPDSIDQWLDMSIRHWEEFQANPTKQIWPEKPTIQSNPAQLLDAVTDARITLATLPGIGEKTIETLLETFDRPIDALVWLTMKDANSENHIKGIGQKTIDNVRQYLALEEYEELEIVVAPKYTLPTIKLAVISDDEADYQTVNSAIASIMNHYHITELVLSDEDGDDIILNWANAQLVKHTTFKIDWNDITHEKAVVKEGKRGKYNAAAPFIRNWKIANYADALLIINRPESDRQAKSLSEEFMSKDKLIYLDTPIRRLIDTLNEVRNK